MKLYELKKLLKKNLQLTPEDRLIKIINFRLATPYKISPFKLEKRNEIPFFPLNFSDCTSFVLTSIALAISENFDEAKKKIVKLHYRDEIISYENRYHFTEERITQTKYFKNISNKVSTDYKSVYVTLNKKSDGTNLLNINFNKRIKIDYIPIEYYSEALKNIKDKIVNIAFCKLKNIQNGHLISHEAFLLKSKYLIHSSKDKGKVVKIDISNYLKKVKFDGIIIIKLNLTDKV